MIRLAESLSRQTSRLLILISGVAVVVLSIHVILNAGMRTFANQPLEGTLEYVGNWYMPLIILTAIPVAQRSKQHIEATIVFDRAPWVIQREFQVITYGVMAAFALIVAYYSWVAAVHNAGIGLTAGVTGIVVWPATFFVPIGFLLLGLQAVLDIFLTIRVGGVFHRTTTEGASA